VLTRHDCIGINDIRVAFPSTSKEALCINILYCKHLTQQAFCEYFPQITKMSLEVFPSTGGNFIKYPHLCRNNSRKTRIVLSINKRSGRTAWWKVLYFENSIEAIFRFVSMDTHKRHFVDILRNVDGIAKSRNQWVRMYVRWSFRSQNLRYVMVSLDKLVTLNLRYRSIGRPAGRPSDRLARRHVKQKSDIWERIEILRALWLGRNARLCIAFTTLTTSRPRQTLTQLGCRSARRAPSQNREFQHGGICPSASASSPKLEDTSGYKFLHFETFDLTFLVSRKH